MIKVGILGTGDISHDFCSSTKLIKEYQVKAVYNRDINKAKEFALKYNIKNAYDNYQLLLDDDIDTIYVGLPNSLHYSYSKEAILAKKNVLIDKPITSNLKELDDLIYHAEINNVQIYEITRVLTLPHYARLKKDIDINDVKFVNIDFCKYSRKYDSYLNGELPNVFNPLFSGGALYDLGVYGLHFAIDMFGMPNDYKYYCNKLDTGIDINGIIILKYDNFYVNINISKNSNGFNSLMIQGSKDSYYSLEAVSLLKNIRHINKNKEETNLVNIQEYSNFYYNLIDIRDNLLGNNYRNKLEQSRNVILLMEKLRLENNILFKED